MAVERIRIRRDAAATWTSENPTLGLGELGIETDTGRVKVGDGATAWITLDYAYAKADRVVSKSADYTITGAGDDNIVNVTAGATDRTITLPAGSGMVAGDELEVHKVDSGTGKVTVARASTDTIDGVTSIDIDSQYDMARLRWTGAYWTLTEYKDHGSGTTGNWTRRADGTIEQRFKATGIDAGEASGNVYRSGLTTWTYPIPCSEAPVVGVVGGSSNGLWAGCGAPNTTSVQFRLYAQVARTGDDALLTLTGRWRA